MIKKGLRFPQRHSGPPPRGRTVVAVNPSIVIDN
jgi:hypothetical protein